MLCLLSGGGSALLAWPPPWLALRDKPDILERARGHGLDARASLDGNDCYSFFAALGDLVVTGPTLTNVNDFRAITIA